MSRGTWRLIEQSKRFHVRTYRKAGSALIVSVFINLMLGLGIYYLYFNQPEHDFYATNGVTSPEMLTPMDTRNDTSVPLLPNDPDIDNEIKVMPE